MFMLCIPLKLHRMCKQDNMIVHTCVIYYMHILYIAYVVCGITLTTRLDLYLYVCRLLFLLGSNLELKSELFSPKRLFGIDDRRASDVLANSTYVNMVLEIY